MKDDFYENKGGIPLVNKILMIASVLCVCATIVVFIFFNDYQKNKKKSQQESDQTHSVSDTQPTAKPTPGVVLDVIIPTEKTIATRFNPPSGYTRTSLTQGSFGEYLRNFELREHLTKPLVYDSATKTQVSNDTLPAVSVLALDLINKTDLQGAANSMIRLYAEYLYGQNRFNDISFNLLTTPVFKCDFKTWSEGGRLIQENNSVSWCIEHGSHCTHKDVDTGTAYGVFKYYLQNVMLRSNTSSLPSNMNPVQLNEVTVGDVILHTDSNVPEIIVDMAVDSSGNKICILARGNTPASEIYIVRNESNADLNPWHDLNKLLTGASFYRFK